MLFTKLKNINGIEFHHGSCKGSDEIAAAMAMGLGYKVVAHPGNSANWQSSFDSHVKLPAKDNLERNRDIVDHADIMIATPAQENEQHRGSGTWQTIRYARKIDKELSIIYPNGVVRSGYAALNDER